jgi:hypothetical protein
MNIRLFSIALMASAIPLTVSAGARKITLNKGDFVSAERVQRSGELLVSVKLSKSGKAKLKKLNESSVGELVHSEIGGVSSDFLLREKIRGSGLEMGPYSPGNADKWSPPSKGEDRKGGKGRPTPPLSF